MCHLDRLRTWFSDMLEASSTPYSLPCEYYKISRSLLMFSGVWPFMSKIRRVFMTIFFNFFMYTALLLLITELVITPPRNVMYLTKYSMYIIPAIGNITAYNALCFRNEALAGTWNEIREFWDMLKTEDEIRIAESYAREVRAYTVAMIIFIFLLVLAIYTQNTLPQYLDILMPSNETRSHKLVIPVYIPFDEEKYYVFVHLVFFGIVVLFSLSLSSAHNMSMLASEHICASLEIIGHVITVTTENIKSSDASEKIIRGIQLHEKTLQFVDFVNRTWEYAYLAQVGYASLCTIVDVVHIFSLRSASRESPNDIILSMVYIITTMLYMWIAFYVGQKVLDASSNFYRIVCTLPWYKFPVKTQKLLILIILRSKKDCYLSVGKTYKISFELYCSIIRMAISTGMIIYSLR